MNTGLDQYMDIFKDAVEDSAAKLTKSFEKILIEVIILFSILLGVVLRIFLCIIKKNCRLCDGRFSISMKYIERTLVEMSGINFPNRLNRKGVFLSSNMYTT